MQSRHLIRGTRLGVPVALALGMSSYRYTHSAAHAAITALVIGSLVTVIQAFIEGRTERRLQAKGILLTDVPIRPLMRLTLAVAPEQAVESYRAALSESQLRIKKVEIDEPLRLVVATKMSFWSNGERVACDASFAPQGGSILQISSIPLWSTTRTDSGVNYTNVFTLSSAIKASLGAAALVREELIDLDAADR